MAASSARSSSAATCPSSASTSTCSLRATPKWFAVDEPLLAEIPAATTVHRCRFLGPRSSSRGDALRDAAACGRAAVEARYAYQRALLPDKAAPWLATAVPAAEPDRARRGIDVVMTTSPPASVHLVAQAIAAATRRPFVADFRDSWLDHPHRRYDSRGVRAKRTVERRMARTVTRRASALVTVTAADRRRSSASSMHRARGRRRT